MPCAALPTLESSASPLNLQATPPVKGETCEQRIRSQVSRIMGCRGVQLPALERRADKRKAFPHLLYLTPIDDQGRPLPQQATVVVGKHLAERGIDFFHSEPIPYRRVIITLESENGTPVHILTDLHWCRFTQHGWYDNGGRFVDILPAIDLSQGPEAA